jgi:predicted Zn finger-like uncharacterized protein
MVSSSLTTRCAHCHTVFRVTTAQLQAHAGQVRCGRCMQVFDALSGLALEPAPVEVVQEPVSEPVAVATATAPELRVSTEPADTLSAPLQELLPDPQSEIAAPVSADEVVAVAEAGALPSVEAGLEPMPSVEGIDADNPFARPHAELRPAIPRRRLMIAAGMLAVVLAAQAVFFYRSEVAARFPLAKQGLVWLCVQAGCAVRLPQRPQSILIEASDLQVIDPANPNRIQLTATLRNHAGYDVAYPALDLVLTNVNDHTLARRIFLPADYLGAGRDVDSGVAANAEMTVRLALETGNLGAAGFRLAVLAAPLH